VIPTFPPLLPFDSALVTHRGEWLAGGVLPSCGWCGGPIIVRVDITPHTFDCPSCDGIPGRPIAGDGLRTRVPA
jgi:hypothetical protein